MPVSPQPRAIRMTETCSGNQTHSDDGDDVGGGRILKKKPHSRRTVTCVRGGTLRTNLHGARGRQIAHSMEEGAPTRDAEQTGLLAQPPSSPPRAPVASPRSPPRSPSRAAPSLDCCAASPSRREDRAATTAAAPAPVPPGEPLLRPSRISDQLDPITELGVLFVDVGERAPAGWSVLSRTASGREANLNKGTGGRKIQLCFTRARGEPPLTDLAVVCREEGQAFDPHEDFTIVEQTVGGRRANLNEGSGGAQIYIAYRRCRRATVSAAAAAVAALSGTGVADEEEERAPIVDLAVLYSNLADGHLLASANVIGEGYLMVRNMVRDQKGRTVTHAPADMNEGSHRLLQKLRNLDTPWNHTRQSEVRLYYKKRSTRRHRLPVSSSGGTGRQGREDGVSWPDPADAEVGHASPDEIDCVRQLGDGAVGSIWLVRYRSAEPNLPSSAGRHAAKPPSLSGLYALKLLRKARMIRASSPVLSSLVSCPLLPSLVLCCAVLSSQSVTRLLPCLPS